MKKLKKLRIFALLTMVLVFCSTMVATTLSRYIAKTEVLYKGETDLDYTVNSVFEVKSQEELFAAINQGYSYIQLSKDVENPLIITQQPTNLEADLILDLNGIEIQRNGPEPILNIGEGVKLTVTDTSSEQTGGLYNPVGSVFNIVGGTLSVVTGNFESGPRYSEYLSYNHDMLSAGLTTERTLVEDPQLVNLTINHRNSSGEVVPQTQNGAYMPIIRSYPINTGEIIYTQGNLYCDKSVSLGVDRNIYFDRAERNDDIFFIPRDTYLYYSIDENGSGSALLNNPLNAEWFYTYYATADTYAYVSADRPADYDLNPDEYVEVTIYAYYDTISEASNIDNPTQYYAAIQMQKGSLEVQSGGFYSYFGLSTTACVNASGGTIKVGQGIFSSRIPDAASTDVLDIKFNDRLAFEDKYFNNFKWIDTSFGTGSMAGRGLSYCILNHGDADVTINSGSFYSSNHNIISMQGGSLEIKEGEFYMTRTVVSDSIAPASAAVYMKNGSLSLNNAEYFIKGDFTSAIYSTVNTSEGDNRFTVTNTSFTLTDGDNQVGIYTENGLVQLVNTTLTPHIISLKGNNSKGVLAGAGGSVIANNYSFYLEGDYCSGIHSTGGSVSLSGGEIMLESNVNCYGVYANSGSRLNIALDSIDITVGYDTTQTVSKTQGQTYAASIGVFMATDDMDSVITLKNSNIKCYEVGIAIDGGSLNVTSDAYDDAKPYYILTNKASSIIVKKGGLSFDDKCNYIITSYNTVYTPESANAYSNTYNLTIPTLGGGSVAYDNLDGVYISGGNFTSNGKVNITHTGLLNDTSYTLYTGIVIKSYAVRVYGGSVNISKADITANVGGGVYCNNGSITLGTQNSVSSDISISTLGAKITSNSFSPIQSDAEGSWYTQKSISGGHAVELYGGTNPGNITIYNGTYEAAYGNGVQAQIPDNCQGTINIWNGTFIGNMQGTSGRSGPASSYGLKVIGGATVNIMNGMFNGAAGGASVTGIHTFNSISNIDGDLANVYIYAGTFGSEDALPTDGLMIFDMANVIVGAGDSSAASADKIHVWASLCPISANKIAYKSGSYKQAYVTTYYGTYHCGRDDVWNEGAKASIVLYNTSSQGQSLTSFVGINGKGYNSKYGNGYYTYGTQSGATYYNRPLPALLD